MAKFLVIAEKPSVAQSLAKNLSMLCSISCSALLSRLVLISAVRSIFRFTLGSFLNENNVA